MLGKLDGKMDALKQSVDTSATSQGTFNAQMQTDLNATRTLITNESLERQAADSALSESIVGIQGKLPVKHGWPLVWSSIAVIVSTITVIYEGIVHH